MKTQFKRFLSVDSPKAIKAAKYAYLNGINYMSPADTAGVGNLCPYLSDGCKALCLGLESGQASMVSAATNWTNTVRESRKRKAKFMMESRADYLHEFMFHIAHLVRVASKKSLTPCVRPNGATDSSYESMRVTIDDAFAAQLSKISGHIVTPGIHTVVSAFPNVQFVDYTKNPNRFRNLPKNYHLTFSRSEVNEHICRDLLARGVNVAVVFANGLPAEYLGRPVIDGDQHDLRHLDPRGPEGFVIGLSPKGNKAKRDTSGFVVRL